ncbi:MAG TPA: septum formation initiator family protein [Verrucomicrobiae bacterium]|nr:septum formation initiator family protein [Verrucomicrobiae bacterium]
MIKQLQKFVNLQNAILLAAILLTLSWVWGTMQALQRNFILQQEVTIKQQEVELLDLETQTLAFQQRYLQSNEYLELAAREHLNKAKPGEKVILLPDHNVKDTQAKQQKPPAHLPQSNFQQWVNFFFSEKTRQS